VPDVAVLGASGYAGALSAQLLWRHPSFELVAVTSRSDAGRRLDDLHPRYRVPLVLEELDLDRHGQVDAAIVAYPHGAASETVKQLRERDVRVVDLSADFRLRDLAVYERHYGGHAAPELLDDAVYGLTELHRAEVAGADIVATPGCFPTAVVLALAPLARAGLIGDVIVDAKTGVSGAGRQATETTHFVAADENVNAYGLPVHRHVAEMDQELAALGAPVAATFRSTRASSCPATSRRPARRRPRRYTACSRTRTPTSRSSSWPSARRACARCATRTCAGSRPTPTRGPAGSWPSPPLTTCGRAPPPRPSRTST
jgi:N-acetyl-gamma-glutamyl-phosphate reductase